MLKVFHYYYQKKKNFTRDLRALFNFIIIDLFNHFLVKMFLWEIKMDVNLIFIIFIHQIYWFKFLILICNLHYKSLTLFKLFYYIVLNKIWLILIMINVLIHLMFIKLAYYFNQKRVVILIIVMNNFMIMFSKHLIIFFNIIVHFFAYFSNL